MIAHTAAAAAAFVLGAAQLVMAKGGARHRIMGRIWVALMGFTALSGFFIHELRLIGPFSPIHLLSAFTLFWLVQGVRAARAGDVAKHQSIMTSLHVFALIVAGLFTFAPGRVLFRTFF